MIIQLINLQSQTIRVIYAYSQRDPVDELSWSDYHGFENRGERSVLMILINHRCRAKRGRVFHGCHRNDVFTARSNTDLYAMNRSDLN